MGLCNEIACRLDTLKLFSFVVVLSLNFCNVLLIENVIVTSSKFCQKSVSSQAHHLYRCGIALALNKLSQHLDSSQVKPLFQFFVPDALNDRSPEVRKCMLDAALSTLNTHGKVSLNASLS